MGYFKRRKEEEKRREEYYRMARYIFNHRGTTDGYGIDGFNEYREDGILIRENEIHGSYEDMKKTYNRILQEQKEYNAKQKEREKAEQKQLEIYDDNKEIINAVRLLGNNNYEDDKIIVKVTDHICASTEYNSTPTGYEVKLKDMDRTTIFKVSTIYKRIEVYRSGMWEKHLLEVYKEKLESICEGEIKQHEIREKYKQLEKTRFKPINDSKFFN